MKRLFLALALILMAVPAFAIDYTADFEWKQKTMAIGDVWIVSSSTTSGGPYDPLFAVPFVAEQPTYKESKTIPINQKTYFVVKRVRADNVPSEFSNEVSFEPVDAPYDLTIRISMPKPAPLP